MIRFQPDTLRDVLWRPLAMAAPDAGVYIEIMAPDLRFAMLLALTAIVAAIAGFRREQAGPLAALLAFAWLAFIPWLATSGNGRYFMVVLLVVGPLCIALVHRLPLSRNARFAVCILLVTVQGIAVTVADPRRQWALYSWGEPYLDVALTPAERDEVAAWVIISGISYSLVAPQVHPGARWINFSFLSGDPVKSPDERRAQHRLFQAHGEGLPLKLLMPTQPGYVEPSGLPNDALRTEINARLAPRRLALAGPCALRGSKVMSMNGALGETTPHPATAENGGFWVCPLELLEQAPSKLAATPQWLQADEVFSRLERACPRFFPPGSVQTIRIPEGYKRSYPGSDLHAYVLDQGDVLYKYWRALNPNHVGTIGQVMAPGFQMDCHKIHGRSGLPWERKL